MARKLTYNELEQTVNELEQDLLACMKAKEDAVKAREELALIFNAVPDYIATIDNKYKIQQVNKALTEKLEGSPEELIGKFCYRYICKSDHPPASCPHAHLLRDGRVHISENCSKQLGMNMLVTSSPVYDAKEGLIGGVHIFRDIKICRKDEETLRKTD